jgi:hypothetical protein
VQVDRNAIKTDLDLPMREEYSDFILKMLKEQE